MSCRGEKYESQIEWLPLSIVRELNKKFSNYVPSGCTFSRFSGINCAKPFFKILPGTRFFDQIKIFVPMGLYMDKNLNPLKKACPGSNFEKRFGAMDS